MDVLLNEILYDPVGADGGYEFVDLAGAAGTAEDHALAGWVLETGNGSTGEWRVAWTGSAADRLAGGLFVIGESAVDPRPHVVVDLDLQNGPDACRLRSPAGEIDVIGWGAPLPAGFFEGAPAEDVAGASLARLPDGRDTHDNAADVRAAAPTPGDYNAPASLVVVERLELPTPDHPPGAPWTFRAWLRNAGREAWAGDVAVTCGLHPGEALLRFEVDPGSPLGPGETIQRAQEAWPPSGVHVPRAQPPDGPSGAAWRGLGEDLVLSEVLSHPRPDDVEWVELLVAGTSSVDLAAVELRDAAGSGGALGGVIRPGSFAIVAPDTSGFRDRWRIPGDAILVKLTPWPALNHTGSGDEVAERVEARLSGIEGDGGPVALAVAALPGGAEAGVSWERISRSLPGDALGSWAPSLDSGGATPGRPNSRPADRRIPDESGSLVVSPRSFRPERDGGALVIVRAGAATPSCAITVHDAAGVRIASLASWNAADGERRAVWDGRRSSGEPAPLGLYVVCARVPGHPNRCAPVVLAR